MASGLKIERNQEATIYVAGLDEKVTETLLCELLTQAGPVINVYIPKDRITHLHQGYGFVEFSNEYDADYAIKIMNMIKLYSKPIKVNKASAHQRNSDVGANLFISNLSHDIDEKLLYDIFSAFGIITQAPKIMRDPDTGNSKGYAFVHFANFEASDTAIELMNGQYICNQQILVSYAFKKNSKCEKHGTAAERLLAARNPLSYTDRPNQMFADTEEINRIFGQMVPLFPIQAAQPPPPPPPLPSLPPLPPIRSPMPPLPLRPPGLSVTNQMTCYNAFPPILPTLPLQQLPSQLPNGNFSQF